MKDNMFELFAADDLPQDTNGKISAVDVVINYIRNLILRRELRTGDRLPTEGELCDILNVGRGSVREAIKRLEAIQLLDVRRGDGTYVASMTDVTAFDTLLYKIVLEDIDFEQVMDYRIQLEIGIMQLAIRRATPEILRKMRSNCEEFERCIYEIDENRTEMDAETTKHLYDLDLEFHKLLGQASDNPLLADVYGASLKLFSPYIMRNYRMGQVQQSPKETMENHRMLLNALENRDMWAAIHAVVNAVGLWKTWVANTKN